MYVCYWIIVYHLHSSLKIFVSASLYPYWIRWLYILPILYFNNRSTLSTYCGKPDINKKYELNHNTVFFLVQYHFNSDISFWNQGIPFSFKKINDLSVSLSLSLSLLPHSIFSPTPHSLTTPSHNLLSLPLHHSIISFSSRISDLAQKVNCV